MTKEKILRQYSGLKKKKKRNTSVYLFPRVESKLVLCKQERENYYWVT